MLYRINNGSTTPTITGLGLAHDKRSIPERAFVGGDLHLDRITLINPTIRQCAVLAGVCAPYVAAAVAIADDTTARAAVLAGELTLLEAAKPVGPESLAEHFVRRSGWTPRARSVRR